MCDQNPRNCALLDQHQGPCVSALDLNKLIEQGTADLTDYREYTE